MKNNDAVENRKKERKKCREKRKKLREKKIIGKGKKIK